MAWSIVGTSATVEATATPLTLTEPAGVADGDLLIATISSRTSSTTAPTASGWTAVASQNNNNILSTTSALASGAMLYRIRSGTPTLAFTLSAGISVAQGRITAYRGGATAGPVDVTTAVTTPIATTSVSVTGLTTTQNDDLIVALAAGGQEATWASFANVGVVDTWSTTNKSANVTLSGSDKIATLSTSVAGGVLSIAGCTNGTAGKYYAEIVVNASSGGYRVGLHTTTGITTTSTGVNIANNGAIRATGTSVGTGSAIASGDILCIAWDAGAERVWFRTNGGNWNNDASADPATGTNGADASTLPSSDHYLWFYSFTSGEAGTLRAVAAEFTQAVPTGFVAWSPGGPLTASGTVNTTSAPSITAWTKRAETVTTTGVDTSLGVFDAVRTGTGATGNLTVTASQSAGHVVIAGAFNIARHTADAWDNAGSSSGIWTLSASDKKATAGGVAYIRSTQQWANETAGKYYAEFQIDVRTSVSSPGLAPSSTAVGSSTNVPSVNLSTGSIDIGATGSGLNIGSFAATDILCMAWNAGTERLWFRKNAGNWNNDASANPATGTNGLDISVIGAVNCALWFRGAASGEAVTLRTELAEYTQTVPSGFTSWMGETSGPPPTTVTLTGAQATAQAGTVYLCIPAAGVWDTGTWDCDYWAGTDVAFAVTGSEATGQAGTVTASGVSNVSTLLTGAQAAGQAGTVTASGVRNVSTTLTGEQATGQAGTVTVATTSVVNVNVLLTGQEAVAQAGTVTATGVSNVSTTLIGSQATGQAGTVGVGAIRNVSTLLTGAQAGTAAGTVTVATATNASTMLTGSEATAQAGTVTVNAIRNASTLATGAQATGQAGTVTVTVGTGVNAPLTGAQAAGQAGTVTITAQQAVSFTLTGAQATAQAGGVAVAAGGAISVGVSGAQAAGQAGTVGVTANRTVSTTLGGAAATAQAGTVTVNAVRNVSTVAIGAQATGQAGTVGITANRSAATLLTGAQASGQAGGVSILAGGSVTVPLSGSQTTGQAGMVNVVTTVADVGLVKVWSGSAWVEKPAKVWTGGAWAQKPVKHWTGSAWV